MVDWQTMQQQAMVAPQVCHEVVCMLARAGFNVAAAETVPAAIALLLQARETSDTLCSRLVAELQLSKTTVTALVEWLEEATVLQEEVDRHLTVLRTKFAATQSIRARIMGGFKVLEGIRLPATLEGAFREAVAHASRGAAGQPAAPGQAARAAAKGSVGVAVRMAAAVAAAPLPGSCSISTS